MEQMDFVTVSDVNTYLKTKFLSDENLYGLIVKGEISNFTNHRKSGHFYFTLKDDKCSIRAVMFKMNAERVPFEPENGMDVLIKGDIRVFERDGVYQLYCQEMLPDGMGALHLAFEQLKKRLEAEGLFEQEKKKSIPKYPKKVGVITSKTGAAYQDIKNVIERRCPFTQIVLFPVLVQGKEAPDSICKAMKAANRRKDIDVLIVGRGGGSIEDLWAFNDVHVAYAVADSVIPVISAVGHEIDYTIVDFVADLRAPTPSAAAELAVPDKNILQNNIDNLKSLLYNYTLSNLVKNEEKHSNITGKLAAYSPVNRLHVSYDKYVSLNQRFSAGFLNAVKDKEQAFVHALSSLNSLGPANVIQRGYSITFKDSGDIIKSVRRVKKGQEITTRLKDGTLTSTVIEIKGK